MVREKSAHSVTVWTAGSSTSDDEISILLGTLWEGKSRRTEGVMKSPRPIALGSFRAPLLSLGKVVPL
jgi:hypothetical protein